ncbi:MAG: hypothetical protein K6F88_00290 [Ruminococcus sp.]|nr:hypothetical protein [Ruminococcus sp.]
MKSCFTCNNKDKCQLEERKRVVLPKTDCAYYEIPEKNAPRAVDGITCTFCGKEIKNRKGVVVHGEDGYNFFCCQKHYSEFVKK